MELKRIKINHHQGVNHNWKIVLIHQSWHSHCQVKKKKKKKGKKKKKKKQKKKSEKGLNDKNLFGGKFVFFYLSFFFLVPLYFSFMTIIFL